jgi:hypothetical protein
LAAQPGDKSYSGLRGAQVAKFTAPRTGTPIVGRAMLTAVLLLVYLVLPLPAAAQQAPAAWLASPNSDDEVIYIDPAGFIRVYDPVGEPKITWVSSEGGWSAAALGDFTGEGDDEIVAVGGKDGAARLVIYDPVVASGAVDANQEFNGIPWKQLYITNLPATPRLVATGEFDPAVPGREIIYTTDAPPDSNGNPQSVVTILVQTGSSADGTAWRTLSSITTGQVWSDISTGDLELTGVDNAALIDEDRGVLAVYRLVNNELRRYYLSASDTREWSSSAIGQVEPETAQPELVLVRRADRPLASLIVWRYQAPDKFVDAYLRDFNPSPRVVFLADINGTGDSEIFMLRNVTRTAGCPPPYTTPPVQLIMRDRGPDEPPTFEVCLDVSNSFRYGTGGDLDGDGKDEVIVISANQLRVFYNVATSFTVQNVAISSNARTIAAGNLDKAGAVKPNSLVVNPNRLDFTVVAGDQSQPQSISISNAASSGAAVPLLVHTSPQVDYVHWSLSSDSTPSTLTVYADAAELLPDITYAVQLVLESPGTVVANIPYSIPVLIRVEKGMIVRPHGLNVVQTPCQPAAAPLQVDLRVLGSTGMTFSAAIDGGTTGQQTAAQAGTLLPAGVTDVTWPVQNAPWISAAQSLTSTVPSTITLTIDPAQAALFNQAHVTVVGQLGGETFTRVSEVAFVCTDYPTYLPTIQRLAWPQ